MVKNTVRWVATAILLVFCATSLCIVSLINSIQKPASPEGILSALEETGYLEGMKQSLGEDCKSLCLTGGIPEELIADFVEEQVVESVAYFPIHQMMGTAETKAVDYDAMKASLTEKITSFAASLRESGQMPLSDEEWEEMKKGFPETASYFVEEIRTSVQLSGVYSVLGSALGLVERVRPYLFWGALFVLGFSLVLLMKIWKKRVLLCFYTAFASAGFLMLVPSWWVYRVDFVSRLGLEPEYLKRLVRYEVMEVMRALMRRGGSLLAAGLVLGAVSLVLSFWEKKKRGLQGEEKAEEKTEERSEEGKESKE